MTEAPKNVFVKMTEGYESNWWGVVTHPHDEDGVEYVRRNLTYTRADMEAAIKRALEEAANMIRDGMDDSEWYNPVRAIRALDPAQFIEEPKG